MSIYFMLVKNHALTQLLVVLIESRVEKRKHLQHVLEGYSLSYFYVIFKVISSQEIDFPATSLSSRQSYIFSKFFLEFFSMQ